MYSVKYLRLRLQLWRSSIVSHGRWHSVKLTACEQSDRLQVLVLSAAVLSAAVLSAAVLSTSCQNYSTFDCFNDDQGCVPSSSNSVMIAGINEDGSEMSVDPSIDGG